MSNMEPATKISSAHLNLDEFRSIAKLDAFDIHAAYEELMPFDIWDIINCDYGDNESLFNDKQYILEEPPVNNFAPESYEKYLICKIRNHDCMWAGHCGSKEHTIDEPRIQLKTIIPPVPPVIERTPMAINKQSVTSGRSLLLKTAMRQQLPLAQQLAQLPHQPAVVSPDSPPMSDDEECKTTSTLKMLQDVISSCDIEDADSDLCEYFEEEDFLSESVEDATQTQPKIVHQYARDNDHSYHKDKNASMHLNNLGIETPSDSEEEIDVVSVGDKHSTRGMVSMVSALPNNPTSIDRQQLQKTMATAITNKRLHGTGIKTILPFRKPSLEQSPAKRKATAGRGIKRTRRSTPSGSPYKKRAAYNHSSDSEAEPSEKRSLHNNMERQRRIDLRNAFEDLRLLVPEVNKKERAAKVVILREAAVYCDTLGDVADNMCRQKDDLRREQDRLRSRLSQLRRALAAKHR